jgi:hypothetical protein
MTKTSCAAPIDRSVRDERDGHHNGTTESERNGISLAYPVGTGVALSPSLPQRSEPGLGTPSMSSPATPPNKSRTATPTTRDEFLPKTNSKDAGRALDLGRMKKE